MFNGGVQYILGAAADASESENFDWNISWLSSSSSYPDSIGGILQGVSVRTNKVRN